MNLTPLANRKNESCYLLATIADNGTFNVSAGDFADFSYRHMQIGSIIYQNRKYTVTGKKRPP